MSMFAEGCYN